jgi:hypothetical protein
MKGTLKVTGLAAVRTELRVLADRVPDTARKQMHRSAARIVKLAKEYAPEDVGNLVDGIQVIKDYSGQNGRLNIDIGIVKPADAFSASGTPLTDQQFDNYVALVHEHYESILVAVRKDGTPGGPSAKTRTKMMTHGEKVGSFFLRTAALEEEPRMGKSMVQQVTKVIDEVSKG